MKIDQIQSQLNNAGLTEKESKVYTAILEQGGAFPSKIAEITGINRSTVYKVLLDLSVRGLINEIEKSKKQFYQIDNPNKITKYLKDKVSIANNHLEKAEKLVPEIESLFSVFANKPKVSYFEGKEQITQLYLDQINTDKSYEMLSWANASSLHDFLDPKSFMDYRKAKERIGITTRGILPDTELDQNFVNKTYKKIGIAKKYHPVVRFVPASDFSFDGEVVIYGEDKVSIINLGKGNPTGTIIQDKTIHDMMKMIFELSWKGVDSRK